MAKIQKITPFLWFDSNAEEAVNFYVSLFDNLKIVSLSRYGDAGPGPKGQVMVMNFELAGQQFMALNGGPIFKFTEAISLVVNCETQNEVDHFWEALTEVGSECQCGWLKDRYGLSWQIVPTILGKLTGDKDAARTTRVMQVMMKMVKLDIAALQAAYDGHQPELGAKEKKYVILRPHRQHQGKDRLIPDGFRKIAEQKGFLRNGKHKPESEAAQNLKWLKDNFELGHGHAVAIYTAFKGKKK